jgi:hypothetical protein
MAGRLAAHCRVPVPSSGFFCTQGGEITAEHIAHRLKALSPHQRESMSAAHDADRDWSTLAIVRTSWLGMGGAEAVRLIDILREA